MGEWIELLRGVAGGGGVQAHVGRLRDLADG